MTKSIHQTFVHVVWAVKLRSAVIEEADDTVIEAAIAAQCMRLRCDPIAIGCATDHVHALFTLGVNATLLQVIRSMKSASSVLMNRAKTTSVLRWQTGYAHFSVDPTALRTVALYIHNQRAHHSDGTLLAAHELPAGLLFPG